MNTLKGFFGREKKEKKKGIMLDKTKILILNSSGKGSREK